MLTLQSSSRPSAASAADGGWALRRERAPMGIVFHRRRQPRHPLRWL